MCVCVCVCVCVYTYIFDRSIRTAVYVAKARTAWPSSRPPTPYIYTHVYIYVCVYVCIYIYGLTLPT